MNLREQMFMTPDEVNALFKADSPRFAYRAAIGKGFLRAAARRFGRKLLFMRSEVDRIIEEQNLFRERK